MPPEIPQPWRDFLRDLDRLLTAPVTLHCLGGFVVTTCYGFPRPTADLDVLSLVPAGMLGHLVQRAGRASPLHHRHGVYLDVVAVVTCPHDYEDRLVELHAGECEHVRLLALDPYDLALAKIERNLQRDRDDVVYLAQHVPFDLDLLRARYHAELRPYLGRPAREDLTLNLWIEMIEETRQR